MEAMRYSDVLFIICAGASVALIIGFMMAAEISPLNCEQRTPIEVPVCKEIK